MPNNSHPTEVEVLMRELSPQWTREEIKEMYELQMTEAEYYSYKNLTGVGNYIIESPTNGGDTEEIDLKADAVEGWYDDEVDSKEVASSS